METKDVLITRMIYAPRELVWKAWTDPWRLMRWLGPKDYTTPMANINLRVGGYYHYSMRSPEGKDVWGTGAYREIVNQERLVMTDSFADEYGNAVPASYYGISGKWPMEWLITVTFENLGSRTKLVLRHSGIDSIDEKDRENMRQGWNEAFVKLEIFLENLIRTPIIAEPGKRDILTAHTFDAPREAVFYAMTEPTLVSRWWGPGWLTTTIDAMDRQPGGTWRFVQHDAEGKEYAFHGNYRVFYPPERIIQTFEFEGMPGHVSVETITLDEKEGKTIVTARTVFESVADRDGMLMTDMANGIFESNDRLADLLRGLDVNAISCNATECSAFATAA